MDALVKWDDGSQNIVSTNELIPIEKGGSIQKCTKVKMFYKKKWYYGTIVLLDNTDSPDSSDNEVLANLVPLNKLRLATENQKETCSVNENSSDDYVDDSDLDPDFKLMCQVKKCKKEGQSACKCGLLFCETHFKDTCHHSPCSSDSNDKYTSPKKKKRKVLKKEQRNNDQLTRSQLHSSKSKAKGSEKEKEYSSTSKDNYGPETGKKNCNSKQCTEEIFAACTKCLALLCHKHFIEDDECINHEESVHQNSSETGSSDARQLLHTQTTSNECLMPESFSVEGSPREAAITKKKKENQQTLRKKLRNTGLPYTQEKSFNIVPPRTLKMRCKGDPCEKAGKSCKSFSEEQRHEIFTAYYQLGDLQLQREFIVRHLNKEEKKRSTTKDIESRRQKTVIYNLTLDGKMVQVCKMFFLNTLGISERTSRTALDKVKLTGVIEPEHRGGRQPAVAERDALIKELITNHISRFPRVESHYCRSQTQREYLNSDLTLEKMYAMYKEENTTINIGSLETYRKIFKSLNLSFHNPKKDLCTICISYRTGDEQTKERLKAKFEKHISEKIKIRQIKEDSKKLAVADKSKATLVFDLQQVIFLPKTNESAVFYKRRLAAFNLTIYDLATKECHCFTWNETISKRGSCEIASCVYKMLLEYDRRGFNEITLFCDGCAGQNKNSMMAAMFLHVVSNSLNIQKISLKFFEPYHGQNEGDAAHSAIGHAISQAGDLFMPSQLSPILTLARRKQPYKVHQMESKDFFDFKELSKQLRILSVRHDNESDVPIHWPNMVDLEFRKEMIGMIYFKTSHLSDSYRSLTLKRDGKRDLVKSLKSAVNVLYNEPPKISHEKYKDLVSLCEGPIPVVRSVEVANYYKSLPHHIS